MRIYHGLSCRSTKYLLRLVHMNQLLVACFCFGATQDCPQNGTEINIGNIMYMIHVADVAWEEARWCCLQSGGSLASVLDEDTFEGLALELEALNMTEAFLGARQITTKAWTSVDGHRASSCEDGVENKNCCLGKIDVDGNISTEAHFCEIEIPVACKTGQIDNITLSWYIAREHCMDKGSDILFEVPNEPPLNWTDGKPYWLGISKLKWIWDKSNETLYFSKWERKKIPKDDEQCLLMKRIENSYIWLPAKCGLKTSYVCEFSTYTKSTNRIQEGYIFTFWMYIGGGAIFLILLVLISALLLRFCKPKKFSPCSSWNPKPPDIEDATYNKSSFEIFNTYNFVDNIPLEKSRQFQVLDAKQSSSVVNTCGQANSDYDVCFTDKNIYDRINFDRATEL